MKKTIAIVVGTIVLLFIALILLVPSKPKTATNPLQAGINTPAVLADRTISIQKGTDDTAKVVAFQQKFVKLCVDYKDAQILTNALLTVDYSLTPREKYDELYNNTIAKWDEVGFDTDEISKFETVFAWPKIPELISAANAQEETEVGLKTPPSWDKAYALSNVVPHDQLGVIAMEFGVTKQEALKLLNNHNEQITKDYANSARNYKIASNTAQAIKTSSTVALFIGGTVISFGGAAAIAAPTAGAALTTGFGANVTLIPAVLTTVSGVDLSLNVAQDVSYLVFGDAQKAAIYARAQEKMAPITTMVNIANLKNLSDPSNLTTIFELGQSAYNYLTTPSVEVKSNEITLSNKPTTIKPLVIAPNIKQMSNQLFPAGVIYNTDKLTITYGGSQDTSPITLPTANAGNYLGKAKITITASGVSKTFEPTVNLQIQIDASSTMTIADSGSFTFSPGGPITVTTSYTLKGDLAGEEKDNLLNLSGTYSSYTKNTFPAGIQLPPSMAQYAQPITQNGTATATGKNDGSRITGDLNFTINGTNYKGTFWADKQ